MPKEAVQTKRKEFRLSAEDQTQLEKLAQKRKECPSETLRHLIWNRPIDDPELNEKLEQLVYEVNKIGVNINQIAHHINAGQSWGKDRSLLLSNQKKLEKAMVEIIMFCRKVKA